MVYTNGKKVLALSGCEAVYITRDYLLRFITGFAAEDGYVIIDKNGTTLYTDKRYIELAKKLFAGTDVTVVLFQEKDGRKTLSNYESVGISFRETSHSAYLALEKAGVNLVDIDDTLQTAMTVKNEFELEQIKKACEIAEQSFLQILPQIKEGMTETDVASLLEYTMRKNGAQGVSFDTIVAFGAHAAVPHHETGMTKLKFGDEILVDFGCKVNGYCSDITRTVLFGDDGKHEEFKKAYDAVLTAHTLVKEQLQSGMTGKDADAIAREYLTKQGYGQLFTHSLGHGIGLNVHEHPSLSPKSQTVLVDGMVFSDEPGVYVEGQYGIRIEDTVTLKDGKVVSFMGLTKRELVIL